MRCILSILFLFGCGKSTVDSPGGAPLHLRLRFPEVLTRSQTRWKIFQERVIDLELVAKTSAGASAKYSAPPGKWDGFFLTEPRFPTQEDETLTLNAKVWDRTKEGKPRTYPVLKGDVTVKAKKVSEEVLLKLSLQVSVREFE